MQGEIFSGANQSGEGPSKMGKMDEGWKEKEEKQDAQRCKENEDAKPNKAHPKKKKGNKKHRRAFLHRKKDEEHTNPPKYLPNPKTADEMGRTGQITEQVIIKKVISKEKPTKQEKQPEQGAELLYSPAPTKTAEEGEMKMTGQQQKDGDMDLKEEEEEGGPSNEELDLDESPGPRSREEEFHLAVLMESTKPPAGSKKSSPSRSEDTPSG